MFIVKLHVNRGGNTNCIHSNRAKWKGWQQNDNNSSGHNQIKSVFVNLNLRTDIPSNDS